VIPSIFVLWTLSFVYVAYGNVPWIAAIFYGLKPAVTPIVLAAVIRIGRKALRNEVMWSLALLAFVGIYFFKVPFPVIVLSAGIIGLIGGKLWPAKFNVASSHGGNEQTSVLDDATESPEHTRANWPRALKVTIIWVTLWLCPTVIAGLTRGWSSTLFQEGVFFSKAAVVTFGGAYAVLPYVTQEAIGFGWLQPGQMMDGLGLAETTPGPLIMVVQFVGFLGGWQRPDGLPPLLAATLGALITTWATFTPVLPLDISRRSPHRRTARKCEAHHCAVCHHVCDRGGGSESRRVVCHSRLLPHAGVIDWFAIVLSAVAFVGMLKWNWGVIPVVLGCGVLGLIVRTFVH
jgi:chromate transporter